MTRSLALEAPCEAHRLQRRASYSCCSFSFGQERASAGARHSRAGCMWRCTEQHAARSRTTAAKALSLIHISEPTRLALI
eukprot:14179480-Alexandrium_andersonii.AAC.1